MQTWALFCCARARFPLLLTENLLYLFSSFFGRAPHPLLSALTQSKEGAGGTQQVSSSVMA